LVAHESSALRVARAVCQTAWWSNFERASLAFEGLDLHGVDRELRDAPVFVGATKSAEAVVREGLIDAATSTAASPA
jgi:hypothetical protein